MKENYIKIIQYLLKQKGVNMLQIKTRDVADAVELTIYQARQYLIHLNKAGVVERVTQGRGRSTLWQLISHSAD
ncbi:FaeA/PapI family transcriptional regulator [Vagococcus sp. WN89Y]|uniref:FaeA/PapI family transcriptional regulator n=1 Tax=Vagococcus sp. WN89Y TaxID=3457258 RepID=UPI003FCD8BFF